MGDSHARAGSSAQASNGVSGGVGGGGTATRGRGKARGRGRGRGRARGGKTDQANGDNAIDTSSLLLTDISSAATPSDAAPSAIARRRKHGSNRGKKASGSGKESAESAEHATAQQGQQEVGHNASRGSGRKFVGRLTHRTNGEPTDAGNEDSVAADAPEGRLQTMHVAPETADLRSRLCLELSTGQYDCAICYACVTTKNAVWACSECFTVLHLSCVKKWAHASVKQAEAQNAMQDDAAIRARKGTWRCPGCQFARQQVPTAYRCWDGRVQDPPAIGGGKAHGIPPHSCGKPCANGKCVHGCAAGVCHPGPCPPCPITITRACFCGSQKVALRCSLLHSGSREVVATSNVAAAAASGVSCGGQCGKMLSCGEHHCSQTCHEGACGSCEELVEASCYCGKESKRMTCGHGISKRSATSKSHAPGEGTETESHSSTTSWIGRWSCESVCNRRFDCNIHTCQRSCHTQDVNPAACPLTPSSIQMCPCGAEALNVDRKACTDAIKTCGRKCGKVQSCGHPCSQTCHMGVCPPCSLTVTTPCRCGETKKQLPCHERQREEAEGGQEVLCQTVCRSLRLCAKHECGRRCCPLYFQAKNKSKRRPTYEELLEQDPVGYHTCDMTCGKRLGCALHTCQASCHRGACPPCLQASFDEMPCHCGRTVLEPPVRCGMRVTCHFPCARRPMLPCGHPTVSHDCHGDEEACPPCIHLVDKTCMCGKNAVANVPCHRMRVSCGQTCNAVLSCGFHRCQATCHEQGQGRCGACQQTCGKPRKCGHPCPKVCHAPAACPETEACQAWVTLLCSCGNVQQRVRCGSSLHNAVESDRALPCTDACLVAQRNAKLAEALGLHPAQHQQHQQPREYPSSTLSYYGNNSISVRRWCEETERTLTDLIRSPRHAVMLYPSSAAQRQFMHELAGVFRLQVDDVDEEPRRSVAIRRSLHAQVPTPTLAEAFRQHQELLVRLRPTALGPLRRNQPSPLLGSNAPPNMSINGTATPPHAWASSSSSSNINNSKLSGIASTAATPSSLLEQQMNALLLRGVFGVEETTLIETLRQIIGSTGARAPPMHARWLGDEEVVVLISNASTARLQTLRHEIRSAGLLDGGMSRLASDVSVCLCDEHGKIVRIDSGRDERAGLASSNDGGGSNVTRPAVGGRGVWAAVAAAGGASEPRSKPASAWGSTSRSTTPSAIVGAASSVPARHPSSAVVNREPEADVSLRTSTSSIPETWDD